MYDSMVNPRRLNRRYCKIYKAAVNAWPLIESFAKYMIQW